MSVVGLPTYVSILGDIVRGRGETNHGFTPNNLFRTRYQQQKAPIIVAFAWVPAFYSRTSFRLWELKFDKDREDGERARVAELPTGEITNTQRCAAVGSAAISATETWLGGVTRVAIEAAIASYLIKQQTPLLDSVVLHWDTYPRMYQKYWGDLFEKMWLPRGIASLLGPATKPEDIVLWEADVSPMAAAQDSVKRHALKAVVNIAVTLAVHRLRFGLGEDPQFCSQYLKLEIAASDRFKKSGLCLDESVFDQQRPWMYFAQLRYNTIVGEALTLLGCAAGSAAGRMCGGARAEYWGETLGAVLAGVMAGSLIRKNDEKIKRLAKQVIL